MKKMEINDVKNVKIVENVLKSDKKEAHFRKK